MWDPIRSTGTKRSNRTGIFPIPITNYINLHSDHVIS